MSDRENQGFREYFRHPDGEEYTLLLKGCTLEEAAGQCRRESVEHRVAFLRLEAWTREQNIQGGRSLLWCESPADRWQWTEDSERGGPEAHRH